MPIPSHWLQLAVELLGGELKVNHARKTSEPDTSFCRRVRWYRKLRRRWLPDQADANMFDRDLAGESGVRE